jgi:hypothetical protein
MRKFDYVSIRLQEEVSKLWAPPDGGRYWSYVRARVVCMGDIFIFNEIWAHDKYIFWWALYLFEIFYLSSMFCRRLKFEKRVFH